MERYIVTRDYFRTMKIGLVGGRPFDRRDTLGAEAVMILSETAAAQLFPRKDPIGQSVQIEARLTVRFPARSSAWPEMFAIMISGRLPGWRSTFPSNSFP